MSASKECIPPGQIIAAEIATRGWSQAYLAVKANLSKGYVCKLIKGQVHLTQPTAVLLGKALDTQPIFWMNLESAYRRSIGG